MLTFFGEPLSQLLKIGRLWFEPALARQPPRRSSLLPTELRLGPAAGPHLQRCEQGNDLTTLSTFSTRHHCTRGQSEPIAQIQVAGLTSCTTSLISSALVGQDFGIHRMPWRAAFAQSRQNERRAAKWLGVTLSAAMAERYPASAQQRLG